MLEFLRRQSQSWLIWVVVGVITIVFIFFFGPQAGGLQSGNKSWAVRINRTPIYDSQLESALGRAQALGQRYDDEERYLMKREIGYDIAMVHLLAEEATAAGLTISDDELHCYIINWNRGYRLDGDFICRQFPRSYSQLYPNIDYTFYSDREGAFSTAYAQDVRRWFGVSVENYEKFKRKELLSLRYLELLSAGVPVTAAELETRWRARNDTIDLELAIFDPGADGALMLTDEEVATFASENDADVRAYYEANLDAYSTERQLHLRRIYIRKPEAADTLEVERARVEALLAQAQEEGADFDALAREHGEIEREAENGGDMGVRDASTLANEFIEAVGDIEEQGVALVEQAYAWSIVQKVADKPAGAVPFEDVRLDVARAVLTEQRKSVLGETMKAQAAELFALAEARPDERLRDLINEVEGSEIASFHTSGPFGMEPVGPDVSGIDPALLPYIQLSSRKVGEIPHVGLAPELNYKAFQLTEEAPLLNEIAVVDGKYVVVRLLEKKIADTVPKEELDEIQASLVRQRAEEVVGFGVVQRRLLLHSGEELPPLIAKTLDAHKIAFQEKLFVVPARDAQGF